MQCCANCFSDEFLASRIQFDNNNIGQCSFCGSADSARIDCDELEDEFSALMDSYERTDDAANGESLAVLLVNDWMLFGDLDTQRVELLLSAILGGSYSNDDKFLKPNAGVGVLTQWEEFCAEIKNENRFFPQTIQSLINEASLQSMLSLLEISSEQLLGGNRLYRARKNSAPEPLPLEQMGGPPSDRATPGRANPTGISYLYVGSTITTCISELRPHKNEKVTVAEFEIADGHPLKLIDLRNPRRTVSPFSRLDEIEQLVSDIELLVKLGNDLAQPVLKDDAMLEYLPSQFLCEYIKSIGFDGVVYQSSLGDGFNIAFFDEGLLSPVTAFDHIVDNVDIQHSAVAAP